MQTDRGTRVSGGVPACSGDAGLLLLTGGFGAMQGHVLVLLDHLPVVLVAWYGVAARGRGLPAVGGVDGGGEERGGSRASLG